ncbi:MAG: hypothetical protein JKY17_06610 [Magnetovibrio sp.]|nr:hypothetical protein [Magnetovibrio sp.]
MTNTDPIIRMFSDALVIMEDGQLVSDLTETQRDLLAALTDCIQDGARRAKGTLTLKLDYVLEDGMFDIQAEVKSSLPKVKRGRTVLWATPENNLCRNNPRQRNMFEDVNEAQDVRSV